MESDIFTDKAFDLIIEQFKNQDFKINKVKSGKQLKREATEAAKKKRAEERAKKGEAIEEADKKDQSHVVEQRYTSFNKN